MTREEKCKLRALHESRAEAAELVKCLRECVGIMDALNTYINRFLPAQMPALEHARQLLAKYERQS